MPTKLKTRCRHVGCAELVDSKIGYCEQHRKKAHQSYYHNRTDKAEQDIYNSRRWHELSKKKKQADPFCEKCSAKGTVRPVDVVHHVNPIPDGGEPYAWDNLLSLCNECHAVTHRGRG